MDLESKFTIGFVVDSSCDIAPELLEKPNVYVAPLSIHFEGESFRDGEEITKDQFYKKLTESKKHPSTSPVSDTQFYNIFRRSFIECDHLIVLTLTSIGSLTYKNALEAKSRLIEERQKKTEVIDTGSISGTIGLVLKRLYDDYECGKSFEEIVSRAQTLVKKSILISYVDDVQYLINGGKVSSLKGLFAKFLKISPLLKFSDGKPPENIGKVKRGEVQAYFDHVKKHVANNVSYDISFTHIKADEYVDKLVTLIKETYAESNIQFIATTGPVLGTNVGLKSFAISFLPK